MASPNSQKRAQERKRKQLKRSKRRQGGMLTDRFDVPGTIAEALRLQKSGQLEDAQLLYRKVLELDPDHADAWQLLGMTLYSLDQKQQAIDCLLCAVQLVPDQPAVLANLGVVYRSLGKLESARIILEQAIALGPEVADYATNLGVVYMELGWPEKAETQFETALDLNPNCPLALMNLGNLWQSQHRYQDAQNAYQQLLSRSPNDPRLLNNLGEALRNQGHWEEAAEILEHAVHLDSTSVEPQINLARNLAQIGRHAQARNRYLALIENHPRLAKPYHYLGKLMLGMGEVSTALELISRAVELDPTEPHGLCSLGVTLIEVGEKEQAESCFRTALKLDETMSSAHGSLLFLMSSKVNLDQAALFQEHERWGQLHGAIKPVRSPQQWTGLRDASRSRRLKIGYVSPDFRDHVVARYFEPVLRSQDHELFESYCYAEVGAPDSMTEKLRSHADHWRFTTGFSDEQVAQQILADEIDILVDLAGHTGGSRIRMFAYCPAPIQVTWLGYPHTTGLKTIDYRLTCEIQDPTGEPTFHTEELYRLPRGSFTYSPPLNSPEVSELPAIKKGYVTFGSLHRPDKVSEASLDLWACVLKNCSSSKLLLFNTRFTKESASRLVGGLSKRGIDPNRVGIESKVRGEHYLDAYQAIDISLDVTPWAGATTTVESLWMGVPVIGFYGNRRSARSTAAVLNGVGLNSLIAKSLEQYADIASEAIKDLGSLADLRAELRSQVMSELMNAARFTGELEVAFREIWHRWCEIAAQH